VHQWVRNGTREEGQKMGPRVRQRAAGRGVGPRVVDDGVTGLAARTSRPGSNAPASRERSLQMPGGKGKVGGPLRAGGRRAAGALGSRSLPTGVMARLYGANPPRRKSGSKPSCLVVGKGSRARTCLSSVISRHVCILGSIGARPRGMGGGGGANRSPAEGCGRAEARGGRRR